LCCFVVKNRKRRKKRNKGGLGGLLMAERKHIVACNQRFIMVDINK
jgi:hypothetical protein